MIRIIKFRAWDLDEKVMIYPSLSHNEKYVLQLNCEYAGQFNGKTYDTVKLPLMQFTGLFDKNEKEIYEGDIVKVTNEGEMYWENKHTNTMELHCDCGIADVEFYGGMWYLNGTVNNSLYDINDAPLEIEVIGNIYENKNLLE